VEEEELKFEFDMFKLKIKRELNENFGYKVEGEFARALSQFKNKTGEEGQTFIQFR